MNKKKGLVYDKQKYFSRLLKNKFQQHISFDAYQNFNYLDKGLKDYSIIVFVLYSEDEMFDFMKVYRKGIPIIICTFSKERLIKLSRIDDILLLDSSKILPDIVSDLTLHFSHAKLLWCDQYPDRDTLKRAFRYRSLNKTNQNL